MTSFALNILPFPEDSCLKNSNGLRSFTFRFDRRRAVHTVCLARQEPRVGRPQKIDRSLAVFKAYVDLDNAYHVNPTLIGKTPEQARGTGRAPKLTEEDGASLRNAGSKCLSAWTQSAAYAYLTPWCRSKGQEVPNDITSFLRFVGDGELGLSGYCRFLLAHSSAAPVTVTPPPENADGASAETQLLRQELSTLQSKFQALQKKVKATGRQMNTALARKATLQEQVSALRKENGNLKRSNTLIKDSRAAVASHAKSLRRTLRRKKEIIEAQDVPQRKRKDIFDLVEGGRAFRKRMKHGQQYYAPESVGKVRVNNKRNGQRKR